MLRDAEIEEGDDMHFVSLVIGYLFVDVRSFINYNVRAGTDSSGPSETVHT